jgi:hypothetical protein
MSAAKFLGDRLLPIVAEKGCTAAPIRDAASCNNWMVLLCTTTLSWSSEFKDSESLQLPLLVAAALGWARPESPLATHSSTADGAAPSSGRRCWRCCCRRLDDNNDDDRLLLLLSPAPPWSCARSTLPCTRLPVASKSTTGRFLEFILVEILAAAATAAVVVVVASRGAFVVVGIVVSARVFASSMTLAGVVVTTAAPRRAGTSSSQWWW